MKDPRDDITLVKWLDDLAAWDEARGGPMLSGRLDYGAHPEQVIDIWRAVGPVTDRAVIGVHGGYFMREFGRDLQNPMIREWVRRGFSTYNIEYRRHGCHGGFRETTRDVWAAVDKVREATGISRFAVVGHSAGGYLAQWLASHPNVELVIAMASVSDLADGSRSGLDEGAIANWMGAGPDVNPALYRESSLVARLPTGAQQILVHGDDDTVVDVGQSRSFLAAARAAGEACDLVEMPGEGHFGFLDPREPAFRQVMDHLQRWIEPR